jgi:hypothetical protein
LIVLLSWRWGLPITLYPSAPPQYRSGVSQLPTSQPLKQGYIVTNKVRPVGPRETNGSKPRGCLYWFKKSKVDGVPCQDLRLFLDWITPQFLDIKRGSRLIDVCIKGLIVGDSLWPRERELFIEVLYNQEKAIAFNFLHIRKVKPDVAPLQVIKTVEHKA